ncbi:kinesin protein KIN-12B [Trifolium repens]|nr:kinesin protein KIN-12B [Trifolium repens]
MMRTNRKPAQKRKLYSDDTVSASSDSGVKVVVRVKPVCNDKGEPDSVIQKISHDSLSINGQDFTFDSVAHMDSTQLDIFELIGVPLVENCLAGFNSSIFAYGQTGSGKTYTMWGRPDSLAVENLIIDQQGGLAPRVFERLFARINEEQTDQLQYQCHCSFLEIYNEQITDLLDPNKRNLQIREDVKSGIYVENLTEVHVSTLKDVNQLLLKGLLNRTVGATSANSESSRSHTVFTCVVESRSKSIANCIIRCKTSKINLVDLAGSERQKSTGVAGNCLKEAGNINRSLSQLGNLINILAEVSQTGKQRHIPYRDSKLTFLLQESLGGNAKLTLLCAISPAQSCRSETFYTLKFAQRGKAIKNKAVVNEVMHDDVSLTHEHELLKDNFEHHPEFLKLKIELKRVQDELQKYQNLYEQERNQRTEAESRTEELRAEVEANRSLAEKTKHELDAEKKYSKELKDAMQIEQYANLEEKHVQLLERHRKIHDGIDDVKKATSEAGVRIDDPIILIDEESELKETSEAVQAAESKEEKRIIILIDEEGENQILGKDKTNKTNIKKTSKMKRWNQIG